MMFIFKLFHGKKYGKKYKNWQQLREGVVTDFKKQKKKRSLFLRTSAKLADKNVTDSWAKNWGVANLSPEVVWNDLKSANVFNHFAQKWHFYAILISRQTITDINKWIFHPATHFTAILLFSFGYYYLIGSGVFSFNFDTNLITSSLLFGVSALCSIVYSVIALMLFIYGKVIIIDDFELPIGKLGEPFFRETSKVAITLSISTAITVGLGIPLTLTLNFTSFASILGALLAGIITAFIFFLSVWGTHFSMENTKSRILKEVFDEIMVERNSVKLEILRLRYTEVNSVPVWPVNFLLYLNIFAAQILPIVLEIIFKKLKL